MPPPLYRCLSATLPPPLAVPMPSPSARYVALCGVRLTNPTSCLSSLRPALSLPLTPRYTTTTPSPCTLRLSTHRPAKPLVAVPPSYPTYRLPHYPAASNPLPLPATRSHYPVALRPPPSRRPTPLRFARLRSRVSSLFRLSAVSLPSLARSLSPLPLTALPPSPATASRRPTSPPSGKPAHPKAARCAGERASERHDSPLRDYLLSDRVCRARACVRVCAVCRMLWNDQG